MNDYPQVPLDATRPYDQIRTLYIHREPELLAALRCGDRCGARKVINHILVHIYSAGEEHSELLKGLLLELVVMMARAAVEAGASQTEVLGLHFKHLSELANIDDDEDLAAWLRNAFDRLCAVMERCTREHGDSPPRIALAMAFMRDNLERELSRDEVARKAGLSPGHFSHLLRESTGRSFSDSLRLFRVEAACGHLRERERPLADIAAACGFCDQSHFTRVFKEVKGVTPKQYRETLRPGATEPAGNACTTRQTHA